MKVAVGPSSQVYHKLGRRVLGAISHPFVTPCHHFWYGGYAWIDDVVDREDVPDRRPCMPCFPDSYPVNTRTRERTETSEYTTRRLEWTSA